MTIAERIYNDGWLLGMEKGKKKGNSASSDCCCRMGQILNDTKDYRTFGRANAGIRATLAESKRDPWIEY